MLSRLGFTRKRDVDAALAALQTWATTNWRDRWENSDQSNLQAELDGFLPDAMDHAQSIDVLDNIYSARITRVLLLGIAASHTHAQEEFEAALGVPMPKGDIR